MSFRSSFLWVVPILFCVMPSPAVAQFNSAIQGVVSDSTSALVPGATVRVTNLETGVARQAETSAEGLYRILSLGAGLYRVEVIKQGFRSAMRERVEVGISETARVDFQLL